MTDFSSSQTQLNGVQAARAAAQAGAARAAEQQRGLTQQLAQLTRSLDPRNRASLEQKASLEAQLQQVTAAGAKAQGTLQQANQALEAALEGFATFTDPRQSLGALSDQSPFLLFPVRIETRFLTTAGQPQLCVRIYPDDCSIDTFEDSLSVNELSDTKLYWQAMWSAGGVEGNQRAAWSNLATAYGSGRAAWLADNYQPVNLAAMPVKASASRISGGGGRSRSLGT